ncbi:hypothetical protein PF002_g33566, partial [Phytophthora fragariae]
MGTPPTYRPRVLARLALGEVARILLTDTLHIAPRRSQCFIKAFRLHTGRLK